MKLSERIRDPFADEEYSSLDGVERWWYRKLFNYADEVVKLESIVDAARELRQSWREDGAGSAQESGALKKFHEALDALEEA